MTGYTPHPHPIHDFPSVAAAKQQTWQVCPVGFHSRGPTFGNSRRAATLNHWSPSPGDVCHHWCLGTQRDFWWLKMVVFVVIFYMSENALIEAPPFDFFKKHLWDVGSVCFYFCRTCSSETTTETVDFGSPDLVFRILSPKNTMGTIEQWWKPPGGLFFFFRDEHFLPVVT